MQLLEGLLVGPATTSPGLCAVGVLRALIPHASPEQVSRRLLPGAMALLARGDPPVQLACVAALGQLLMRHRDDSRVAEQVLVHAG